MYPQRKVGALDWEATGRAEGRARGCGWRVWPRASPGVQPLSRWAVLFTLKMTEWGWMRDRVRGPTV